MKTSIFNTITSFAAGAVLTAGLLTWTGSEALNNVQGRVDRLAARVISLVEEVTGLERELGDKNDRYVSQGQENQNQAGTIAHLEEQLRLANQAAENLDNNTRSQYENVMRIYNERGE